MERATLRRLAIGIVLALVLGVGFFVHPPAAQADFAVIQATGIDETLYDLSDDGRYVAYVKLRNSGGDETGLVWYDMQTGTHRWLFQGDVRDAGAVRITADNQTVLWVQNLRFPTPNSASMTMVDVATAQSTTIFTSQETIGIENAVTSADGQFIAFVTENLYTHNSIWLFDTDTRSLIEVSRHATNAAINLVGMTPDSNMVVAHIVSNSNHTIHVIPRTGDAPVILSPPPTTRIENATLAPDGSAVYFFVAAPTYSQLYRAPLSGAAAVAIGDAGLAHGTIQFSPDGAYGFYSHYVNGQGTVFRLTVADQSLAILYSTTIYFANDEHLAITVVPTDNRILIAEANNGNSDNSIRLLNVGYAPIKPARLLTTEYGVNNSINGTLRERRVPLIITPDGAHVVYTQPSGTAFYLKRVALEDNTLPVRLYPDPLVRDVLLSRSGTGLFFNVKALPAGGIDDLYYLDFADLNPNLLYRGQTHPVHLLDPALDNNILFTAPLPGFNPTISLRRAGLTPTAYLNYSELSTTAEGSSRSITVDFYPRSADTVTVTYSAISGTATLGDDFTLSPAQLVFAPGQVSQTLTITALADATVEGLENSTLQFQNQQTGVTELLNLSFNELVAVSAAPAHLGATTADGRRVVFQEAHGDLVGLYSKDLATGTRYELHAPDASLSTNHPTFLSPDGRTVLYFKGAQLFQAPFTGGSSRLLVTLEEGCTPIITFTTDSFNAQLLSDCTNYRDILYRLDLTVGPASILLFDINFVALPLAVSPNGDTVIYQREEGAGGKALYVVPTYGDPFIISEISNYVVFDSPTSFLYVQQSTPTDEVNVLTRFDLTTRVKTPIISLSDYYEGLHFSSERQTLYYRTHANSLIRYKLGALNADSMGGRAVTSWLQPVADESQFLYYQEYTECHRYGCDVVSGEVGTVGATGDQWHSSVPARYTQVSPDGRALVYGDWSGNPVRLYQKTLLPMAAERVVIAFPLVPNDLDAWRTGDNRIFAVVGATLQSTALYENRPAVTHFRNSHIPTLYTEPQNPQNLTLFAGDLLYFQDAEGYLYALGDVAPVVNSANPERLVAEGDTVTVTVSLAATPLTTATVAVNVVGGTATVGTDVSAPPTTLTFAPFQREQTFTLTVAADGVTESVEELRLTFTPVSGASAGVNNTYRLRIADQLYQRHLPLMQHIP